MTELARPGWHGTAALARSAAGFLCGPFRCVTPGCAVADIQVSQRDWKSATAAVRRSRAEAHGVAAWSSLSPEGSGQRGHDRDLGSCSFGNRCLPASAASARPLPCGEAGSHRDGRPGDREPLLSSDARHFGAAWDCEQLCSPVLISGPAPLLWAPGGHGGGPGRLPGAAVAPDTSRDSGAGPVAAGPRRREARAQRLRQPGGTACHFLPAARPDNLTALGLRHD